MSNHEKHEMITAQGDSLFSRVVSILEQARSNVVRSVNTNMVLAYWLIGQEIVLELQGGEERAEYGRQLVEGLSAQLTARFGRGFSTTNLWYFRQFYLAYQNRVKILHTAGGEFAISQKIHPAGGELTGRQKGPPAGDESLHGFSPQLSWSHYRALMRITKSEAREFYEQETIACGWDKRSLERHIHSQYFEKLLKSQHPKKMQETAGKDLSLQETAIETLKNPYVLEFLGLPQVPALQENQLESAIITHLQAFLLELGKGFAFVARQKRLRFDDSDLYVDLVFYNCILKCYLLIDLKMGELSHKDVGQMDGYVRMFNELYTAEDDNPTIGLILCTEKNEAVARYSVLNERKQVFASRYMLYLPSEEELALELKRERKLIEAAIEEQNGHEG